MAQEIEALERNQTWSIVDLPPSRKPINCKWVYKVKYNSDGNIKRYKACLVIRGDTQIKGFDYNETFALVAKNGQYTLFSFQSSSKRLGSSSNGCQQCFSAW